LPSDLPLTIHDSHIDSPTTIDDVRAAARRIRDHVLRTPLRRSEWLSNLGGGELLLKLETLQPTFSYKVRGAFNAVLRLAEQRGNVQPLVTASAGNHGRALAFAARSAGMPLTVYVPEQAPRTKLEALRESGADLRLSPDYDSAERQAKEHGRTGDALYISPYANPDVIAGAGTVALEILDERPDVEAIAVGIGGGGLISGTALAAHQPGANVDVLGVEVTASSPFTRSLAAGHIVAIDVKPTLADSLAGNLDPDTPTFDIVRRLVDRIGLANEEQLRAAIAGLAKQERLIVEGAGAAAVAGILAGTLDVRGRRVAVVVSGANIDLDVWTSCVAGRSEIRS
jgi:threonine dehydratase